MNTAHILFHLMWADFLERARRPAIWIVAALGVGLGYLSLPPADSETLMLALGPWRGIYNSAWVGIAFGLQAVMILPLFAFYVIKNSISRDRETRVGQIIATTPISRPLYLLGKWLSNLAVLTIILLVLSLMAILMQLLRQEALAIQPAQVLLPLWLLSFPVLAILAAVVLLFESLPLLSGGAGNILYFFGWLYYLSQIALPGLFKAQIGMVTARADMLGVTHPIAALQSFATTIDPAYNGHFNIGGANYGRVPSTALWPGMEWTGLFVAERLVWLSVAVALVLLTSLFFDRFDPARAVVLSRRRSNRARLTETSTLPESELDEPALSLTTLSPLPVTATSPSFPSLLKAELRLMLTGRPRWFYGAALLLTLISLIAPAGDGPPLAALAWLWPLLLWSELGTRNRTFHTQTLVYAAPEPSRAQFWLPWLAGVLLALAATAPLGLKALVGGDVLQWLGILAGSLFVPSLAMACGLWSGNSRLFQVVYLLWWFSGAVGNIWLDFMSFQTDTGTAGISLLYLLLAGWLLLAAVWGERKGRTQPA